jgi:hypothetical protein
MKFTSVTGTMARNKSSDDSGTASNLYTSSTDKMPSNHKPDVGDVVIDPQDF